MWAKNLLFIGLCLFGLTALAAGLLRSDRIAEPVDFFPNRIKNSEFGAVVDQIDREFQQHWADKGLQPTARADDLTIARRLSLALIGANPSLEEIRAIEALPESQRIEWWVSRLLEDRRYADYVAERLARAYVGTENGPFIIYRRRRFVTWLSDSLHQNTPYDELVRRLIADKGIWTSNPAVNFVSVTVQQDDGGQPDPIRLAGRTTRAFLGMRIDCLQCHDDRLDTIELGTPEQSRGGLQSDFHKLAAFFSEADVSLMGISDKSGEPYEYQYLYEPESEIVEPAPPFLPELLGSDENRREQLARWVTHEQNKPFARAAVNRIWALLFGRPLVDPIDNIPLFGDFPPGMETLADDFIAHDYDLRRLIRMIASTRAFQNDSRADFEITLEHEQQWAAFPLTRLRPEQVAGSLIQSSSLKTLDANTHIVFQLIRFGEQNDFIRRYGDTGEDEFEDRGGTITQRLLMMNGKLVKERSKDEPLTTASAKIAILAPNDQQAVETAYLATLSRRPTLAESQRFVDRLAEAGPGKQRQRCLEDLYWVLFNCTEFSWNH